MIRLVVLLLLAATPAAAHGTLPGGGGFYAGAMHPFLAGDHLILLFGLGLALGKHGERRALIGLLVALIAGFWATTLTLGTMQPAVLALALAIGCALAAGLKTTRTIAVGGAVIAGFLVGADTDGPSGANAIIAYAGVTLGVFLIVLNAMALAHLGARKLNGVPLRVAGSWIAAAAMLVLAFVARTQFGAL
jgi:urease accessory protein